MSPKSSPLRTCTGCGQKKEKVQMIRLVVDPSGRLIADLKGSLPSRGAYVCPDDRCIEKASAGRLAYSLRIGSDAGIVARELTAAIASALRKRVFSLLGQARKSGRMTCGTTLVEGEIRRGKDIRWLALLAADASPDTAERIEKKLKSAAIPFRVFSDKDELGRAVGKSPRSVVLVKDEGIARVIRESLDRYQNVLRNGGPDK